MDTTAYCCVRCRGSLHVTKDEILSCTLCSMKYPILGGIPVLVTKPAPYLFSWTDAIENERTKLRYLRELLVSSKESGLNKGLIHRLDKMVKGVSINLSLMEKHCTPIIEYVSSHECTDGFLDWFFSYTPAEADPYEEVLRYFCQDWIESDDFLAVKDLITKALIEANENPVESIAVLGCGACGLLYHLAEHAQTAYGIDFAIPTVLAAKQILDGHKMKFCLPDISWPTVQIEAPKPAPNIHLIAANVTTLPFGDHTLSVIVTQFLLDLMGNFESFVGEITRVLKKDGIWINFSKPIRAVGDPICLGPRTPEEMLPLFEELGFFVITCERKRFKLLNLSKIYDGGVIVDHECHFFVVKKIKENACSNPNDIFVESVLEKNQSIWNCIPRIVDERKISISKKKIFATGIINESSELNVVGESIPIVDSYARIIESLLKNIDGIHSLSYIYRKINSTGAFQEKSEFIEFIRAMALSYYLIDISYGVDKLH